MEVTPAKPVDVPLVCDGGGAEGVHGVVLSWERDTRSPRQQGNLVTSVTSSSTSALLTCCTMAPNIGEASTSGRQSTRVRQPTLCYSPGREQKRGRSGRRGSQGAAQLGRNTRTSQRVLQSSAPPGLPRQSGDRGVDSDDSDGDRDGEAGQDSGDRDTSDSNSDNDSEDNGDVSLEEEVAPVREAGVDRRQTSTKP